MSRITTKQRSTIVRLFHCGTSMHSLALGYGVPVEKIEAIIREAMKPTPGADYE